MPKLTRQRKELKLIELTQEKLSVTGLLNNKSLMAKVMEVSFSKKNMPETCIEDMLVAVLW